MTKGESNMNDEVKTETTETPVQEPTQETVQQDTQPKAFEIPTEAQELVGEGKKYQSPEDALKSVPHAQKHIETLESELASVREELTKRQTTQELIDELKSGVQPTATTVPVGELNQDNVMDLVNQTIATREANAKAESNAKSVAEKFTAQYGDKAEDTYNSIAKELNLSVKQLNELAATSPTVVLKAAGLSAAKAPVASSSGDINTEALSQQAKPAELSAKVEGGSTKDLLAAWGRAKAKINQS
ncbi:scaffold protein [Methylophilales phage MEP402]|nr:scaffold protein [Methylophilales phage MEP402]